ARSTPATSRATGSYPRTRAPAATRSAAIADPASPRPRTATLSAASIATDRRQSCAQSARGPNSDPPEISPADGPGPGVDPDACQAKDPTAMLTGQGLGSPRPRRIAIVLAGCAGLVLGPAVARADDAPVITAGPAITGVAQQGETLTASATWT